MEFLCSVQGMYLDHSTARNCGGPFVCFTHNQQTQRNQAHHLAALCAAAVGSTSAAQRMWLLLAVQHQHSTYSCRKLQQGSKAAAIETSKAEASK